MARVFDRKEFNELVVSLTQPGAIAELGVLAVCLLAAWLVVRLMRGRLEPSGSILFGERVIDGVLFPVLALAFAFAARVGLEATIKPAVFRVAIPILISLVVIRLSVRVLSRTLPSVPWVRTVERTISWLAWIAAVLWLTGVLPMVLDAMDDVHWKIGATRMTLRNVVEGTITAGIVLVIALWVSSVLEKKLLRNAVGHDLSLRKIAATLVRTVLLFVGLMFALSAVGIDLTALSVLGGAIGVGLGFGLQKIAANYISGFVILAERSLRIGDMVKVDTFEGRITDIRTRYTVIRSLNGREAIIPNETLITTRVENSSLADPRVLLQTSVQVAYGTDVRQLQPRLEAAVAKVPRVVGDPGPSVQLATFSADGMDLNVNFWIRDSENGQGNVRSDVNLVVLEVLRAEGVEIPFPQRVVHAMTSKEPAAGSVPLEGQVPSAGPEAAKAGESSPP
jgi:small-conductance mechanosensitive channel